MDGKASEEVTMRKGPVPWTAKATFPGLMNKVNALIDSSRWQSAKDIYDQMNIVRFTSFRSFQRYVTTRRRSLQARRMASVRGLRGTDSGSAQGAFEGDSNRL